ATHAEEANRTDRETGVLRRRATRRGARPPRVLRRSPAATLRVAPHPGRADPPRAPRSATRCAAAPGRGGAAAEAATVRERRPRPRGRRAPSPRATPRPPPS